MTTTNGTPERIDRIEAILATLAESQAATRRDFDERLSATRTEVTAQRRDFDERLSATQAIIDSNTQAIANLSNRLEIVVQRVDTLSESISALVPIIQAQQANIQAMQAGMQVMQGDIRGLQTENRRILERLERGQEGQS